jgi:nitroreductase
MDIDKAIKERHSVRSFKKGIKIDYRKIIDIIEAGAKAPLAGNSPCIKYLIVSNKDKIKQLADAAQQDFIGDVEWIVVVCSDKKFLEKSYYERGKIYARQQAGAAIENMLLKITDLGLATCWVGAFSDEMVKRILRIPDNIDVEAMLPIGEELGKKRQLAKPDMDSLLFFDEWKNKFMGGRKSMLPGSRT